MGSRWGYSAELEDIYLFTSRLFLLEIMPLMQVLNPEDAIIAKAAWR